jgi:hypothetical protein
MPPQLLQAQNNCYENFKKDRKKIILREIQRKYYYMIYKIAAILSLFLISIANASEEQIILHQSSEIENKTKNSSILKEPVFSHLNENYQLILTPTGSDIICHILNQRPTEQSATPLSQIIQESFSLDGGHNSTDITSLNIHTPIDTIDLTIFPNLTEITLNTGLFTEKKMEKILDSLCAYPNLKKIKLYVPNSINFCEKLKEYKDNKKQTKNIAEIIIYKVENHTQNPNLYEKSVIGKPLYKSFRIPDLNHDVKGCQFYFQTFVTACGRVLIICNDERNQKENIVEPISFVDIANISANSNFLDPKFNSQEITILQLFFPISSFDGFELFSNIKALGLNVEQLAKIQHLNVKELIIKALLNHPCLKVIEISGEPTDNDTNLCKEFYNSLKKEANEKKRTDIDISYKRLGSPQLENLLQQVDDALRTEQNKPAPSSTKFATASGFLFACVLAGLHQFAGPKLYPQVKKLFAKFPVTKSVVYRNQPTDNGTCKIVRALFPRS